MCVIQHRPRGITHTGRVITASNAYIMSVAISDTSRFANQLLCSEGHLIAP